LDNRQTQSAVGLTPFVAFRSTTFGAEANATYSPITCPNRRKQPER